MRIAVADDGALFRDGLVLLLTAAGHEVVHLAATGDRLAELVAADPVDVAVLDVRMPPGPEGGLAVALRIRARHPGMGLLMLSHHADTRYVRRVLEIGPRAVGYRLKDKVASLPVLAESLARVARGGFVVEPAVARRLVDAPPAHRAELAGLPVRDRAVLRLLAGGLSSDGIGAQLRVPGAAADRDVIRIFAALALPDDPAEDRLVTLLGYLTGVGRPC